MPKIQYMIQVNFS